MLVRCLAIAVILRVFGGGAVQAETRTYTYNARGELTHSAVTASGPANGVQTTITYDAAGNRQTYVTTGSNAPIRYPIPIAVPINGISIITIPE